MKKKANCTSYFFFENSVYSDKSKHILEIERKNSHRNFYLLHT